MLSIEQACRFAGVDLAAERESPVLAICLAAAVAWYEKAGVPARENDSLYDFWVMDLTAWMYDNRGVSGAEANIPPYIVSSVHQIRSAEEEGGAS